MKKPTSKEVGFYRFYKIFHPFMYTFTILPLFQEDVFALKLFQKTNTPLFQIGNIFFAIYRILLRMDSVHIQNF